MFPSPYYFSVLLGVLENQFFKNPTRMSVVISYILVNTTVASNRTLKILFKQSPFFLLCISFQAKQDQSSKEPETDPLFYMCKLENLRIFFEDFLGNYERTTGTTHVIYLFYLLSNQTFTRANWKRRHCLKALEPLSKGKTMKTKTCTNKRIDQRPLDYCSF